MLIELLSWVAIEQEVGGLALLHEGLRETLVTHGVWNVLLIGPLPFGFGELFGTLGHINEFSVGWVCPSATELIGCLKVSLRDFISW